MNGMNIISWTSNELKFFYLLVIKLQYPIFGMEHQTLFESNIPIITFNKLLCTHRTLKKLKYVHLLIIEPIFCFKQIRDQTIKNKWIHHQRFHSRDIFSNSTKRYMMKQNCRLEWMTFHLLWSTSIYNLVLLNVCHFHELLLLYLVVIQIMNIFLIIWYSCLYLLYYIHEFLSFDKKSKWMIESLSKTSNIKPVPHKPS